MENKFRLLKFAGAFILLIGFMSSCKKEDINVNAIAFDQTDASLSVGSTLTLNVVFTPVDATNKNLTWMSGNENIATVTGGVITGVAIGTTYIKAVSGADTTKNAMCTLTVVPSNGQQITVSGDITSDTKWYENARYFLSGFVYVKNNATLTIEPGTIIKGVSGTKGTLIIERGSKIMAIGTSTNPIVFTSDKPVGQRASGDWGGVVLCGKAKTNKHDNSDGVGIAEGGIGSIFGGTDDTDNSGIMQFVRIEFPGIPLTSTSNSEINGLTLYAVGSGTTIDHIQVSYSGDDSYEWFGGTVSCKYIVALRGLDDDFDTDNGFRGKLQFLLGLRDPNLSDIVSGSNGFESDNDADGSQLTPLTKPIFSNVTLFGPLAVSTPLPQVHYFKRGMHIRRSSQLCVYNSIFVGWPKGLLLDGATGNSPVMAENNTLQIEKCILAGMTGNFEAASGTPANPYSTTQIQAYFEATNPARNNIDNASISDIIGANLLSITSPVLLPAVGSSYLTGASFTNTNLTDSFFTAVSYKGAFGTTDWTSGWCNFNPQTTSY